MPGTALEVMKATIRCQLDASESEVVVHFHAFPKM